MNLAARIDRHPADRPALLSRGEATTYGELRSEVAAMRGGLAARGVGPGDTVAIIAGNDRSFVSCYLAVLGVGAIAVPLNPASPPAEIRRHIEVADPRLVIVGPAAGEAPSAAPGEAPSGRVVEAPALAGPETADLVERRPDDGAALLFTSGTAGASRAALLTHGNLAANIDQVLASPGWPAGEHEVVLGALPFFHVFGLNAVLGVALAAGASVVLLDRFDPEAALEAVAEHRVTIVTGVPTMWSAMASLPRPDPATVASVRVAVSGAAPLDPAVPALVAERLGLDLAQGYGLTEASPVVTSGAGIGAPPASIGRPLPGVAIRLVDDRGDDVLVGDPGEIWVNGPNVFPGYWRDPEATAAALTGDGWLRTGDIATVDDDGLLYLVDRAKDLIIVSGFNVFPAEVEAVITTHPAVAAAAVVGVPDAHSGEAVRAFVVPAPGASVDAAEIASHCAQHLARYKCPASVVVVDEIPEVTGGKVSRRALR